ncbi:MAG: hypothetical protein QXO32_01870 [Candidatus Bathyarchaeia archaeon]
MPSEIFDVEDFVEKSGHAIECRVKRVRGTVKLKLRTSKKLYTLKTDDTKAEELLKNIKCKIVEI